MMLNWGDPRLPVRFWNDVMPEPNTGCWLWTKIDGEKLRVYRIDQRVKTKTIRPNRFAYEALVETVDKKEFIVPTCGVNACVNPDHMRRTGKFGFSNAENLAGQKFGKLTAIERRPGWWVCKCDCGREKLARANKLKTGAVVNCGCQRHGKYGTPAYASWQAMLSRCRNKNTPYYKNYGGRGIAVCERWNDFKSFVADMGERPAGMTLDRIDPNGNYEPDNCRWADAATQNANRRTSQKRLRVEIDRAATAIERSDPESYSREQVVQILRDLRNQILGGGS